MVPTHTPAALHQWLDRLRHRESPAFLDMVQDLLRIPGVKTSSAADLSYAILRDPALAARLLEVANHFYANTLGQQIGSVNRAVELIGFNAVRRIALSLVFTGECLKGPKSEHLARDLARCLHAATQARSLAQLSDDPDPEEVCIAALLHGLGSLAFWSSGDHRTVELDRALRTSDCDNTQVELAVLGFDLHQLTRRLSHGWQVSRLLHGTPAERGNNDPRSACVRAGHEIAAGVKHGWNAGALQQLIARLANEFETESRSLMQRVRENAVAAAGVTTAYGASQLGSLIPQPDRN